jgi:DNA-binding NtrC family response regulator
MGKILVVDDDRGVLFMLEEVLREGGHDVVAAFNADETLERLDGVDAALVDMHLPGTSGVALAARIRECNAALPVILLTADSSPAIDVDARRAGAFDVMTKPVDIDELWQTLERALQASRWRAQGRRLP